MSFSSHNEFDRTTGALDVETTLRVIASVPAPEGLENRVKAGLRESPRRAKVVAWPFSSDEGRGWMHSSGMRAVAAAAIVLVVAGGGWGVYSHIRPAAMPTAVAAPQPLNGAAGFSSAGAKRVPQTLEGPVVPSSATARQPKTDEDKLIAHPATTGKKGQRAPVKKSSAPAAVAR